MKFRILGHACLEVTAGGRQLICDPWLVGSAYWRSWWNYPPIPDGLVESLSPDFIYLTHMHWDHFHGPTLRRLGLSRRILIPKTPDRRIYNDLKDMGCDNLTELTHGQPFEVAPGFVITSYQFGHFPDSILMIEADGTVLMNANDCKIMGLPLKQVLDRHPAIDFVLRSHSSANARLCFDLIDRGGSHVDDQSKYSAEFAEFVRAVNPRYAIPFASNNCYLHPETQEFNAFLNLGIKVQKYFEEHRIEHPKCVVCAPGDGWDDQAGFSIQDKDWYSDIDNHLQEYKRSKEDVFRKTERLEKKAVLKDKHMEQYARQIFDGTPFPVRRLFKGKPITIVSHADAGETGFELDIYNKRLRRVETVTDEANPIQIHAHARVLRMCIHQVNWSSLGISKRVRFRVRQQDVRIVNMFLELNDMFDCEVLPLSKSMNPRFVLTWARRWRELFLYAHVVFDLMKGSGFVYAKYLPGVPAGPPAHQVSGQGAT